LAPRVITIRPDPDRVYTCPGQFWWFCPGIVIGSVNGYYLVTVDILGWLSPSHWLQDPTSTIEGPIPIGFASLLGVMFVASVAAWILAPNLAPERRMVQRLIGRIARWGVGLSLTGLVLLLFRWQLVPFLSKRLWLLLWGLSVIGVAAYFGYYWKRVLPVRAAAWEESERKRRYLPKAGSGSGRSRRRSRRRR
jgi:hypothetical protein